MPPPPSRHPAARRSSPPPPTPKAAGVSAQAPVNVVRSQLYSRWNLMSNYFYSFKGQAEDIPVGKPSFADVNMAQFNNSALTQVMGGYCCF